MRALLALLLITGCGGRTLLDVAAGPGDAGRPPAIDGGAARDGGSPADAAIPLDGGPDAGPLDAGSEDGGLDAGPEDAGPDCAPGCEVGCALWREGFEDGFGDVVPDTENWAITDGAAFAGAGGLNGLWSRGGGGCPITTSARLGVDLDLTAGAQPTLVYQQRGQMAFRDTLRILASRDGGDSWFVLREPDDLSSAWSQQRIPLPPEPRIRFAFELENVCGDPLGIDWSIDDVAVCVRR